ncbi:MAG: MerR family transcriptional regulator [Akkermansia sp.]
MNYSISALSKKTGLSIHTLRFYEKEGILRHVERTASGRRVYSEASLGCIIGILCLKEAGLSLPQIKDFFDSTLEGNESLPQRLALLQTARANLMAQREELERNIQFVETVIAYGEGAQQTAEEGGNPDEIFPFLTLKGIAAFPYMQMKDGKLEPCIPEGENIIP